MPIETGERLTLNEMNCTFALNLHTSSKLKDDWMESFSKNPRNP